MEQPIGLIVCGGQSTRMGKDKSLLDYHGLAQRYYLYDLLQPLCKKVFLSCNSEQAGGIDAGHAFIVDDEKYKNTGPMAALLTVFEQYPNDSLFVIACDHPFIRKEDLLQLLDSRDNIADAVCFFNESAKVYEPLLAVYEKKIAATVLENFNLRQYSLQAVLIQVNACKVCPQEMQRIRSIDTMSDHLSALEEIKRETAE